LCLPVSLFADDRVLRLLDPHPCALGLAYPPLDLKGNIGLPVVDGMADVGFMFHNAFDLRYRPCVAFFLWCASIDIGESPVTLEDDKSRRRYFFRNQYPCSAGRPFAVNSKVKNLLHDPAGLLFDYQLVLNFLVLLVPEVSNGADTLS